MSDASADVARPVRPYIPTDRDAFELLLRHNREVADLRDPLRLALAQVPEPHPTWPKIPDKLSGLFPGVPRFTARGYAYRYQADFLDVPGCTSKRESFKDGDMPLADDGSLCPSVAWPGALLTDEQASRIVTLIRSLDRNDEQWPTKCGFDPHHAFIFYGESGAPVAILLVCFKCNQWRTYPAQPGLDFTPGVRARNLLSAVCRELGLGGCGYDTATMDRISEERTRWWDDQNAKGEFDTGDPQAPGPRTPFVESASGVSPDKSMAEAARSESDRRRLCAWYMRRPPARDRGCLDAAVPEHRAFADCLESFPSCPAPVWRVEACVRATADEPCKEPAKVAACEGVADCRWGTQRIQRRSGDAAQN